MSEEDVQALEAGRPLTDARLEALRCFTNALVKGRGHVSEEEWSAFVEAGWGHQQALEVVFAVGMKVMSNFTNALAGVPLDEAVVSSRHGRCSPGV
ncbi:hypothetical protein AAFN60_08745 [Roseibacillus persicicus]|uniref:carboxymuconolactone decarboxylase family protein n=1 Tax=Roseibacillus persicicus TaxID=454148 RepID=UPI00398B2FCA